MKFHQSTPVIPGPFALPIKLPMMLVMSLAMSQGCAGQDRALDLGQQAWAPPMGPITQALTGPQPAGAAVPASVLEAAQASDTLPARLQRSAPRVTLDFANPPTDLDAGLKRLLRQDAARSKRYYVIGVAPERLDAETMVLEQMTVLEFARAVARALAARGVDPDQVVVALETEPGATGRPVRIYAE